MCFCCCFSRNAILIYMMVISIIAFIYGIVAMSNFGSSTKIYKAFKAKLDSLPSSNNNYLRRLAPYGYSEADYNELAKDVLDSISLQYINNMEKSDKSSSLIGNLKAFENSIGVILFVFPCIFLICEIVFLVFACGNKEFTPLPITTFNVLNIIKIICVTLSTIFIFLSILYGVILVFALFQYYTFVPNIDRCVIGIVIGMVFGYYSFWFYITLSCGFCKERGLFLLVGTIENPGAGAKFDANGNPIVIVAQPVQPITYSNMYQGNNGLIPTNQANSPYQPLSINSKNGDLNNQNVNSGQNAGTNVKQN